MTRTGDILRGQAGAPAAGTDSGRDAYDCYITPEGAVESLLAGVSSVGLALVPSPSGVLWDPSAGTGNIVKVLRRRGYNVIYSDLRDYGYPGTVIKDFLAFPSRPRSVTAELGIVMNPPYRSALQHIKVALAVLREGEVVCAMLRLQFLESKSRVPFFRQCPPRYVMVFSERQSCQSCQLLNVTRPIASMICFAWFVWVKGFMGRPEITWLST